MISARKAEKRALVVGLVVAAVPCGGAAAAIPGYWLNLHARLAPVARTTAIGRFTGTFLVSVGATNRIAPSEVLPPVNRAVLTWELRLPALHGPISASLRLRGTKSAAPVARVLCAHCATTAGGKIALTKSQGLRIATSDAVVVVTTTSATLRGPVKVSARIGAQPVR